MNGEITACCLDHRHRKLIVGDDKGTIRVFNYDNGGYMKSLTSHKAEIVSLYYCERTSSVISAGKDNVVLGDQFLFISFYFFLFLFISFYFFLFLFISFYFFLFLFISFYFFLFLFISFYFFLFLFISFYFFLFLFISFYFFLFLFISFYFFYFFLFLD